MYNNVDAIYGTTLERATTQTIDDTLLKSTGVGKHFLESYGALLNLERMTNILDDDTNTFMMLNNDTTHEPTLLQLPDYVPSEKVDNTEYESLPIQRYSTNGDVIEFTDERQLSSYHADMAAFIQLGKWMDYLREEGVYDNTRIIIVSDHGIRLWLARFSLGDDWYDDLLVFNSVLMVKDFDSATFNTDDSFMTNADVPTIATSGLLENPVNPFTGTPINNDAKMNQPLLVQNVLNWDVKENNGTTYLPGAWYAVQSGNIFDLDNWEKLGEY